MSGVIGKDGIQYEHCNECGYFIKIDKLFYEKPGIIFFSGRDLCLNCCIKLGYATKEIKDNLVYLTIDENQIEPANYLLEQ